MKSRCESKLGKQVADLERQTQSERLRELLGLVGETVELSDSDGGEGYY